VKRHGLDGGFNFREGQGLKREEKDLPVISFELHADCGLIPQKGEGSLAKGVTEAVRSVLDRWIFLGRLRLDLLSEGVRADITHPIGI
jgi:hypothetical protein